MPDLGPHAVFIWSAYGITVFAIAALAAWTVQDERKQERLIRELEAKGIRRRSAKSAAPRAKPARKK